MKKKDLDRDRCYRAGEREREKNGGREIKKERKAVDLTKPDLSRARRD